MRQFYYFVNVCFFLIIWLAVVLFYVPVYATENIITNEIVNEISYDIEDNEENENANLAEKIENLEGQKNLLENQTELMNAELECINEEITETVAEVTELSQKIFDKQTEMEELELEIEILNDDILEINKQLDEINEKYDNQKKQLENRLVAMYEMGGTTYIDMLLNSEDIVEFFSNYYYISVIANADNDLLNSVKDKKEEIEKTMVSLNEKESEIAEKELQLKKDTVSLSNLATIKNQILKNLSAEELEMQQQIEEYQSQVQQIESEIKLLSLTSDGTDYVGGVFAWPVPGYTNITSQFGMRTHPITRNIQIAYWR